MTTDEPTITDGHRVASALYLQLALSALCGLVVTVIWAASGGGYFWPVWIWLVAATAIALHVVVRRFVLETAAPHRALDLQAGLTAIVIAFEIVVWALGGGGYFWPIWPLVVLGAALGVHAVVIFVPPRGSERALTERVDELTRTRRGALDVQAAELRRIERDLHDGAQARLVALSMLVGRAEERLDDRPEAAELVRQARDEANAAIAELRDLARGIAPPVLADRGLASAAEALGRRGVIPVRVESQLGRRPPPVVETAAYFVVAEALTNVAKHAPEATARVELDGDDDRLVVEVADDGPGGADATATGLTGLRHRVEALDGTLTVTSPPGGGTIVRAELPCGS